MFLDKNYNIFLHRVDNRYPLFKALLERMPQKIICSNSKDDFALQHIEKNNIALLNYKWIFYNQHWIWHLVFDIDKKYSLNEIKEYLEEKFNLTPTWLCYTDKGVQFGFMLINVLKSKKQIELAQEAKIVITAELTKKFEKVDLKVCNRLRGYCRNPLLHEYIYTGCFIELLTLKKKVLIPYLPKPKKIAQNRSKTQKKENKKYPRPRVTYKVGEITINYQNGTYKVIKLNNALLELEPLHIGNRNFGIWYNLMANTQSTDIEEVFALAEYFNTKAEEPLGQKELLHIVKHVIKYNKQGKNYVYISTGKKRILSVRTYNINWEVGKMGFKKIQGLNYEEYKEEVRKRQSLAGKLIGIENLKQFNAKKSTEIKKKILKAIKQLQDSEQKITAVKVAELAGITRQTASKYIKELKKEGII